MDQSEVYRLRLALSVVSGRCKPEDLTNDDLLTLEYDLHKISYYGRPDADQILRECEYFVGDCIVKACEKESGGED